jgi:hypothetical protein
MYVMQCLESPTVINKPLSVRALGRKAKTFMGKTTKAAEVDQKPVDLSLISSGVHYGCMGLPQELVDHIMDMLRGDFRTLTACSLTCKAMFVSTRHHIHHTLRLIVRKNMSFLAQGERIRYDAELRYMSFLGERGLLHYTRQVYIRIPGRFTPHALLPHLHYFQSLDRVHTLTIEHYYPITWANHFETCFSHFYPTLTSLTLRFPLGYYRLLLQFALQFPKLENLCLEWHEERTDPDLTLPFITNKSPPLRGHLRLVGIDTVVKLPMDFLRELPNGINFRSVELEEYFGRTAQDLVDGCARTLEDLTITTNGAGKRKLPFPLSPTV